MDHFVFPWPRVECLRGRSIKQKNMQGLVLGGGLDLNPKIAIHIPEFFATKSRTGPSPDETVLMLLQCEAHLHRTCTIDVTPLSMD